jgi:hypothetical protein
MLFPLFSPIELTVLQLAQALSGVRRRESQNPFTGQSPETWMAPGREYLAPSSSFFFGPGVHKTSLTTYLPSQVLVDKLLDHYWKAVHILARTVHRPSFERQYDKFWTDINSGIEPRVSFQAVVFAALLSSAISMSDEMVMNEFAVDKTNLVENFKLGTEAALARANFLQTTKLETLQAFVMYLVSLIHTFVEYYFFPTFAISPNSRLENSADRSPWSQNSNLQSVAEVCNIICLLYISE